MAPQTQRSDVRALLTSRPVVVGCEASVRAAARQIEVAGSGAAVVGHTRLVDGILSEHDIAEAVARGLNIDATPVSAIMTPYFSSVDAEMSIDAAKDSIRHTDAHFVAVTDAGEVVGLLTAEEVLRVPSQAPR